jgi:hypothetical protein
VGPGARQVAPRYGGGSGSVPHPGQLVEQRPSDHSSADAPRSEGGWRLECIDDDLSGSQRIVKNYDTADANNSRYESDKKLEANAQTQSKPADVFLTELVSQVLNAKRVFVFKVLRLYL